MMQRIVATRPILGRLSTRQLRAMSTKQGTQTGHQDVTTNIKASHNENVVWSDALLSRQEREDFLKSKNIGATLWVTGLSGSGKSTVGAALERKLLERGIHAYRLDGDNIRFGLNKGLGFSAEDREENLRRIGEVAALFADCGVIAITSFISPYKASRDAARVIHKEKNIPFFEVYADVPLSVAESRDPKGLYKKARAGELKNFTGIDDPYEAPTSPELVLPTHELSVEESCDKTIAFLEEKGIIKKRTLSVDLPSLNKSDHRTSIFNNFTLLCPAFSTDSNTKHAAQTIARLLDGRLGIKRMPWMRRQIYIHAQATSLQAMSKTLLLRMPPFHSAFDGRQQRRCYKCTGDNVDQTKEELETGKKPGSLTVQSHDDLAATKPSEEIGKKGHR
eukprot:CAMPEP_0203768572 /NCGR_PEP_ID=MMETSP0099_2-20121227/1669_1 /ASSEMBLY_ACC=CAM_ASM_000209 /TAXON_ID=96639 /ORGANISM=" , Strain NY0313808BC1" /LENGTH=391 /DNA_ID=CAMNT_0050665291 /DNA_START=32 /DNA_END=1205 /DNA_ORIENTATION=-